VDLNIPEVIENVVLTAREAYLTDHSPGRLHHLTVDSGALWPKLDHLLYFPILGLTRPRDLYYYQGAGLKALYGFTYKYMTLEHFLGQLTWVQVGDRWAAGLAQAYVAAWYPAGTPLTLFADWHIKPHWTKNYSHAGHVTMWGRVMPGTKQLILNGPQGRLLGGWNYPIDTHLSHILVDLETELEKTWQRPVSCTITDSEGGGLPLGEAYAAAQQCYISVLPRARAYSRADFSVEGAWEPVRADPEHRAAFARWADAQRAAEDPRQFVLLRPRDQSEPTRIYTGRFTEQWRAGDVPWLHRQRWPYNERRIRELITGANLNVNYGYTYQEVPHRTRQREWEQAQARVDTTARQLSHHQAAVHNLRQQLAALQTAYARERDAWQHHLAELRLAWRRRRVTGRATKRASQRVARLRRRLAERTGRFQRRQRRLLQRLAAHKAQAHRLRERLTARCKVRDAIDTETLCRERELEKDQIMLDFQILLGNLHDWVAHQYLAPQWRTLSLEKATQMIYRKAGRVRWYADRIEVELEPYRYVDQQRAMEVTCARFNAANLRWRDGRALHITVATAED
jgi:hypothetical protein